MTDGLTPLTVLLFLGTAVSAVLLTMSYLVARAMKRESVARLSARLLFVGIGAYVLLLLGASAASRNRTLSVGVEKHICEIDCHLAYAVVGETAETLAEGRVRHTVTVRVRFDEETISARRSRAAALTPNSRFVALVDADGHQYVGSTDGLKRSLIPGETYTTDLVFDVPANARDLRLVLRNNDAETAFIIGHENSLLHGKTLFSLAKPSQS
jgi:hypothetical protein